MKKKNKSTAEFSLSGEVMMIMAAARLIKDNETVLSCSKWARLIYELAAKTHAPHAKLVEENGTIISHNEVIYTDTLEVAGKLLQNERVDVAIIGAEQIDQFGNLNSTLIGKYTKPWKRLGGWSCANDALTLAKRVIIVAKNRKETLKACDFLTAPGYLKGAKTRAKAGLIHGPTQIVTDMCVFGFDEKKKRAFIAELNPGITVDDILKNTDWRPLVPKKLEIIDPPNEAEKKALGMD